VFSLIRGAEGFPAIHTHSVEADSNRHLKRANYMPLRKFLTWMGSHRIASLSLFVTVAAAISAATMLTRRSAGVLSAPLRLSSIVQSVYGIGTVTALRSFQIKAGVISTIDDIYVKEGEEVQKGERLIKIESNVYLAPFSGTVTALPFKVGENIFSQGVILSLVSLAERYLVVSLEQQGALRVLRGQPVVISFDSLRDQNYPGEVESVYSSDGNFLARINVSNLPPRILPGMTADVAITIQKKLNVLVIPIAALDHDKIWTKRGRSLARETPVKLGIVDSAFAEVLSGDVRIGDRILIKP
jgi:membrane fusion protein, macrolide-specific efflux system